MGNDKGIKKENYPIDSKSEALKCPILLKGSTLTLSLVYKELVWKTVSQCQ